MSRHFSSAGPQYLANTTASPVSTGYPLSVSAWINTEASGNNRALLTLVNTGTGQRHLMYCGTGDGLLIFSHDGSSFSQASSTTGVFTDGVWNQVGIDIQGSSSRNTIVNGVLGIADTGSRVITGLNRIYAGAYHDGSGLVAGFYNDGYMGDVGVWNATLTQDEWTSLAGGASPRLVRPQSLVAYWPMFTRSVNSSDEQDWVGSLPLTPSASPPSTSNLVPRVSYPGSHRQVFFTAVSASNSIAVPAGSLVLAAQTPTVSQTANQLVSVPAASLSLTAQTPTVTATANQNIAVPLALLTLTGLAPTITGIDVAPSNRGAGSANAGKKRRYQVQIDDKVYEFRTEQQAIGALSRAHEVARKAIREREQAAKQVVVVAKPEPVTPPTIVVPDDSAAIRAAAEETNRKIAVAYAQAQMRAEAIYAAYLEQEDEDEAIFVLLH